MARQNTERQKELEPERIRFAKQEIENLGYVISKTTDTYLVFNFKGGSVVLYPYSGWHSGNTINDGRGLEKLLKQIKKKEK